MIRAALFIVLLARVCFAACTATDAYSTIICADFPCHYYRLDETSGTAAADMGTTALCTDGPASGTYTGTFTLNQTHLIAGTTNPAVSFNGSRGFVNLNAGDSYHPKDHNGSPGSDGWSMELWFNTSDNTIRAYWWGKTAPSAFLGGYVADSGSNTIVFNTSNTTSGCNGGTYGQVTSSNTFSNNGTHHVVATTLGSGSGTGTLAHMRIYLDGTRTETTSFTGSLCAGETNAEVGAYQDSFYDTGRLDDPAIYMRELTQVQVTAHYLCGSAGVCGANTSGGIPYTVKRPAMPKFPTRDFFDAMLDDPGYVTGNFLDRRTALPQAQELAVYFPMKKFLERE